jgi:hypothetical protein
VCVVAYLYEVSVFVERGWWVVDVADVGARTRVATLSQIDAAARLLIARRLDLPAEDFDIDIRVLRAVPSGVIRGRWRTHEHFPRQ